MKKKKIPIAVVEWEDAWGRHGWTAYSDAIADFAPMKVFSVGFIVKSDKTGIMLCQGHQDNNQPLTIEFIPKSCIKKIKKVKY